MAFVLLVRAPLLLMLLGVLLLTLLVGLRLLRAIRRKVPKFPTFVAISGHRNQCLIWGRRIRWSLTRTLLWRVRLLVLLLIALARILLLWLGAADIPAAVVDEGSYCHW